MNFIPSVKICSRLIIDLHAKHKTVTLLEKNIKGNLHDLWLDLDFTPKEAHKRKKNKNQQNQEPFSFKDMFKRMKR